MGCSPLPLNPNAARVELVHQVDPSCQYLGDVVGSQGNFFTGSYTTDANLEIGAINDIKNKAAQLGANKILLLDNHPGISAENRGSTQTNMTYAGGAYLCAKPNSPR